MKVRITGVPIPQLCKTNPIFLIGEIGDLEQCGFPRGDIIRLKNGDEISAILVTYIPQPDPTQPGERPK